MAAVQHHRAHCGASYPAPTVERRIGADQRSAGAACRRAACGRGGGKGETAMIHLVWSAWLPLWECWLGRMLPNVPGVYRIRRVGREDLDYIGQTGAGGMTLKKRMGMLRGIYGEVMPYRDPHTAGPALWALRHMS